MKEISYSEFKKTISPGNYFLICTRTGGWVLAKAKKTLTVVDEGEEYERISGYYAWKLFSKNSFSRATPVDWDALYFSTFYSLLYRRNTVGEDPSTGGWKLFTLTESETKPFKAFFEKEKQLKIARNLSEKTLKGCIKDILEIDIAIPELELGQELILKRARHKVDVEKNTVELMLNTDLPYIGLDSIQLIETAIEEASKDKKWKLRFMVLVPRPVSIGGFPGAAFKLRLFLE